MKISVFQFIVAALIFTVTSASADTSALAHKKKKSVKKKTVAAAQVGKKSKSSKKVSANKTSPESKLSTDINFNDSVLHGRYQTPEETTARVENEKLLSDLLAVRTNFKDRLKKSSEQN